MRILVAHLVGLERSGGMSRLMGRAHDELERAGHEVDYLSADDVGATTRGTAGRFLFPWAVRKKVVEAVRQRRPYDVVNVHEPHGAAVAMLRGGQDGTAVVAMTHGVEQRGWEMSLGPFRDAAVVEDAMRIPGEQPLAVAPGSALCGSRDLSEYPGSPIPGGEIRRRLSAHHPCDPRRRYGLRRDGSSAEIRSSEAAVVRGHVDSAQGYPHPRRRLRSFVLGRLNAAARRSRCRGPRGMRTRRLQRGRTRPCDESSPRGPIAKRPRSWRRPISLCCPVFSKALR